MRPSLPGKTAPSCLLAGHLQAGATQPELCNDVLGDVSNLPLYDSHKLRNQRHHWATWSYSEIHLR